ncbi:thiamine-phosphate kinase [Parvibium lacunae]|uniref:Thiamine-monophosphate kinase n=1 Tax=Parvibium lacunae TaxID=1888893 RepID=A0A368L4M5_9BURK|nr:thiamine-phosphate kinase [Parvibium lacunae]RCS58538.1 thiamine-phosphate kinase [Parvibium lacunae]
MGEFDLIKRYFTRKVRRARLGVGDDCALIAPMLDMDLAISTDMLVSGRHFFPFMDPRKLGHKALAVNLSDLAAMGAVPRYFTLSLALPKADDVWLESFSTGLFELAEAYSCELIGGDTTKGALTISITVIGESRRPFALLRSGAKAGDDIWVSGELGDAALALRFFQKKAKLSESEFTRVRQKLETPQPRISLGLALRPIASSAIDISDGLVGDLGHILTASGVGARIDVGAIPVSTALAAQSGTLQYRCALAGGDDYELCFTASPERREAIDQLSLSLGLRLTRIGEIVPEAGLMLLDKDGNPANFSLQAYDHFA